MRRLLLPVLALVLFSVTVSAETYILTGTATYADNSQVQVYDITIDCETGESNCLQFNGATTQTDRYGNYTLAIGVDEKDDGTRILLKLRGEEFLHTINLELLEASGGSITKNIKLEQYPSPASTLECPTCGEVVAQHQLLKHLVEVHDMELVEAGELTGKAMRNTWSEEE